MLMCPNLIDCQCAQMLTGATKKSLPLQEPQFCNLTLLEAVCYESTQEDPHRRSTTG